MEKNFVEEYARTIRADPERYARRKVFIWSHEFGQAIAG